MKWSKFNCEYDSRVVKGCFNKVYLYIKHRLIRCDTLIWDTHDSRHRVTRRDDKANLVRMYFHVIRNVLAHRWPRGSRWAIFPDENSAISWNRLKYLIQVGSKSITNVQLRILKAFGLRIQRLFLLHELMARSSQDEPLIQVADILAGVSIFSRKRFEGYMAWSKAQSVSDLQFNNDRDPEFSNSESVRFPFISELRAFAKRNVLGVGLQKSAGLRTYNPISPLNFWLYEPQSELDKAPTKVMTRVQ